VNIVIKDIKARSVVTMGEPFLGNRHSYACRNALSEGTGCRLHPRNPMVLRVPRGFAVELTKVTDIVERYRCVPESFVIGVDGFCPRQMKRRPEKHRSVTVREDKAVAVRPNRILGIEAHNAIPDRVNQRSERHWRTRMPGLRLLDRVYRERANCVDR